MFLQLFILALVSVSSTAPAPLTRFTVTFTKQTLGLQLSKELVVTGFGHTVQASTKELVHVGDTIVAVNDQPLSHLSTKHALTIIRDARLPKRLEFTSYSQSPPQPTATLSSASSPLLLRVLDIDQGLLGTINMVPAQFGTWSSTLCTPQLLAFATPIKACTALETSSVKGKLAVVERGSCSFLAKGWQVYLHGAVGLIVINNEENVVSMPSESEDAALGLNMPVVMVRKSAEQLLLAAYKGGSHVQLFDNTMCGGVGAKYGSIEATLDAIQLETESIMQMEIDSNADIVMEDPLHRGGRVVFSWPGGESSTSGEFLQFSSGPRTLPQRSIRIVRVEPVGACTSLDPASIRFTVETNWFAVIERGYGCSFATKISNAANAGAAGVIIANDEEYGMEHGKVGGNKNAEHKIPVIMITRHVSMQLHRLSQLYQGDAEDVASTGRMSLLVRPSVSALWSELGELVDLRGWPSEVRDRRKLWKRLSKRHHPDKEGGSEERFSWLRFLYENVATQQNEAM